MDASSVASEKHIEKVMGQLRVQALEDLPRDVRKRTLKEARVIAHNDVFGVGHEKDGQGNPIEQGLGSAGNQTAQSIAAYEKYCRDEPDYEKHLARMKLELGKSNIKRAAKARADADDE